MAEGPKNPLGRFWQNLRQKTTNAVGRQAAALARGKVAGRAVTDDAGQVLVDAGHVIDDAAIARAEAAGKLADLAAAAMTAQVQDLKEQAAGQYHRTDEGRESWALGTMEAYAQARGYIGYLAGLDVTDIRGNVIVPAGKKIEDADVRAVREADQLAALIFSAQQGGLAPPGYETQAPADSPAPQAPLLVEQTAEEKPPPPRRTPLPVLRRERKSDET